MRSNDAAAPRGAFRALPSPPHIMAVVNQKGGVGKTTTAVNLSAAFALSGRRALLIDLDPQGNASTGLGIALAHRKPSSGDLITRGLFAPRPTVIRNLFVIPASADLRGVEGAMAHEGEAGMMLREAFARIYAPQENPAQGDAAADFRRARHSYDYIFLDCPPGLSFLTQSALISAHSLIVPLQCEFYALEGLSQLLRAVEEIRQVNPPLRIDGVLLTMADKRNSLSEQVEADARGHLRAGVYGTVIPRNVRISEAPSHGLPALLYDGACAGSVAYRALAAEILRRDEGRLG